MKIVNRIEKVCKYIENGTFINLLREKICVNFINLFCKNKNASIYFFQCRHYNKLAKEFKNVINEPIEVKQKIMSDKVWFCWLQGYENAPELVKACYNSLKTNMPNKEIVFLSENNIDKYIKFPDFINEKYKKGNIGRAHYSDLLRISLLCEYGGTWIDSTVLCTSNEFASYITELPFFAYKEIDLSRNDFQPIVSSNWLISSESNNEICLLTQKLLFNYWKKYNYAIDYFIFHFFFSMATKKYDNIWKSVPTFNNVNPHIMQFELNESFTLKRWEQLTNFSGFHKLNHHLNYCKVRTIYEYIIENFLEERIK